MSSTRQTPSTVHLLALLTLALPTLASPGFDCSKVVDQGVTWDLSFLKGPHLSHWQHVSDDEEVLVRNYTVSLDICAPLKRTKGVDKYAECPTGTRICAIEKITEDGRNDTLLVPIPVAGDLQASHGKALDSVPSRLKFSESSGDAEKEGVRVQFAGGHYNGKEQKAIIEFLCDQERTGLEGVEVPAESKRRGRLSRREDEEQEPSLKFLSYKDETVEQSVWGVLRMEWKTKYACEKVASDPAAAKGSWGFFTWLIIVVFLGASAYLIFGSWLNYNRYGARGWDLVPHGDALRDVPYLMKDWGRRVVGAVQGGGSGGRGGYSAVQI